MMRDVLPGRAGRATRSHGGRAAACLAVVLCLFLAACGAGQGAGASGQADPAKIVIGGPPTSDFTQLYVGVNGGVFDKQGLDVSYSKLSPPNIPAALVNGSIQASGLTGRCERAHRQGIPVVVVANSGVFPTYTLLARGKVRTVGNLRGGTIITTADGSTPALRLAGVLNRAGIGKATSMLNISSVETIVSTFRSGKGDGVFVPANVAAKAQQLVPGSHVVVSSQDAGPPIPNTGLCVAEKFLKQHPDTVRALIRGVMRSVQFVHKNPARTKDIIEDSLGLDKSQASLVYKLSNQGFVDYPIPSKLMFRNLADLDSAASGKKVAADQVESAFDLTVARQVASKLKLPKNAIPR